MNRNKHITQIGYYLKQHILSVHEWKKSIKCYSILMYLRQHLRRKHHILDWIYIISVHEGKKVFKKWTKILLETIYFIISWMKESIKCNYIDVSTSTFVTKASYSWLNTHYISSWRKKVDQMKLYLNVLTSTFETKASYSWLNIHHISSWRKKVYQM